MLKRTRLAVMPEMPMAVPMMVPMMVVPMIVVPTMAGTREMAEMTMVVPTMAAMRTSSV
jgi:hypothetical protein